MGRLLWPLTEKDAPLTLRAEIWTADEPKFTSDTLALELWPTETEPKLREPGEI